MTRHRRMPRSLAIAAGLALASGAAAHAEVCEQTPTGQQFGQQTYCASSVLAPQGKRTYGPLNAFENPSTAWVEGAKDDGVGEWINIGFHHHACFRTLIVRNGYGRNTKTFSSNGRVRRARITTGDGLSTVITLPDTNAEQRVRLPRAVKTAWVRLTILDVYRGTRWRDTAISLFVADLEELNAADKCR